MGFKIKLKIDIDNIKFDDEIFINHSRFLFMLDLLSKKDLKLLLENPTKLTLKTIEDPVEFIIGNTKSQSIGMVNPPSSTFSTTTAAASIVSYMIIQNTEVHFNKEQYIIKNALFNEENIKDIRFPLFKIYENLNNNIPKATEEDLDRFLLFMEKVEDYQKFKNIFFIIDNILQKDEALSLLEDKDLQVFSSFLYRNFEKHNINEASKDVNLQLSKNKIKL